MRFTLKTILFMVLSASFLLTSCGKSSEGSAAPADSPAEGGGGGGHIRQGQADMRNDTTQQPTQQ